MNELVLDKEAYQTNRRRIFWAALGMMISYTAATIYDLERMSEADSIRTAQYLALSRLGAVHTLRCVIRVRID